MREWMKAVTNKKHQHGIALVLVLWATTLLTVIAASFAFSMRTDTLLAQNLAASARAQALADAGVQRALYEMFKPIADLQRWKGDGVPHQWEFGGGKLSIMVLDVSGKIDLNSASDDLLKGMLKSVGLTDEESNILLDAIVDWRDGDDLPRPKGAEVAEYKAAGLKYRPSNAPFDTGFVR
jgi:general secretion pathway protein K